MSQNNLPTKVFLGQELKEDDPILVIGYNESLIQNLPSNACTIDPSISKIQTGYHKFQDKTFLTKDLKTFSLGKTYPTILSHNTLQLCKDLTAIMIQIEKHLSEEATLYFPLRPCPQIETFLQDEKWDGHKTETFQIRDRTDIEDAVLAAPFNNLLIKEKLEHTSFYSEHELQNYFKQQLSILTDLNEKALDDCSAELSSQIYENHDMDQVLTISTPWILVTLSNEED
jgi:hypothetical protein